MSQAVASLTKATELDPQHLEAHYQLGLAYQKLGERANATAALRKFEQLKAAKTEPGQTQDPKTLLSLADTYFRLQKSAEAEKAVSQLALLAEKDPQLRLQLGLLLIENEKAPRSFEAAGSRPPAASAEFCPGIRVGNDVLATAAAGRGRSLFPGSDCLEARRSGLFLSGESVRTTQRGTFCGSSA